MAKRFTEAVLPICNPSGEGRSGRVVERWRDHLPGFEPPSAIRVTQGRRELAAQLDRIDPDDAQSSEIVIDFDQPLSGGDEHYKAVACKVTVTSADAPAPAPPAHERTVTVVPNGARFSNQKMHVFFERLARPWNDDRTYFAGAASNIEVFGTARIPDHETQKFLEFLDANTALWGWDKHDEQKRAMQIDSVCMPRVASDPLGPHAEFSIFDKDVEIAAHGNGPVRSWVTLRSTPFTYEFNDPATSKKHAYACRLYRVISLYERDATYLTEQLFVKGVPQTFKGSAAELAFSARYFMSADLGPRRNKIVHYPAVPDWFSIYYDTEPQPGYAFATDVHARHVWNPPIAFPRPLRPHLAYSWDLGFARRATCLHMFRLNTSAEEMERLAGQYWFSHIYKPLRIQFNKEAS
jgi:hypothetical protein